MERERHSRDVGSAAELFCAHEAFIRQAISFHVQNEEHADDLFQDFFLSLIQNPLPRDIQDIESYLYRAITRDIADAVRRTKQYRNHLREHAQCVDLRASQKTPVEAVVETEQLSRVFELIDKRLPRTHAQALAFHYRDGCDAKEIARVMGVHVATARGYVAKGLSRIRRLLRDKETIGAPRFSA